MTSHEVSTTAKRFLGVGVGASLVEVYFAVQLLRWWPDLKHSELAYAYQAAAALLVGWPTVVFALAATYAAFLSASASEQQAIAAHRQAEAADAQAQAARMAIRPVLLPVFEYYRPTNQYRLHITNEGEGVASQITWAIYETDSADLNGFISPRELSMAAVNHGGFSGALHKGTPESVYTGPFKVNAVLLLVHCIDLSGNVCQTQMLTYFDEEKVKGVLGFGTLTLAERIERQASVPTPVDPRQTDIFAYVGEPIL